MLIGYARVSTKGQDLALQQETLEEAGCDRIFSEKFSGRTKQRPELVAALDYARAGDTILVTKLDRFGRNLLDILTLLDELKAKQIGFRSLAENWADTSNPATEAILPVLAWAADFERRRIVERVQEGVDKAKRDGKRLGRPPVLSDEQVLAAKAMFKEGASKAKVARAFAVSPVTIQRYLS